MANTPETPDANRFYYIARRSCGCAVSYMSADNDTEEKRKQIARHTGDWHGAGYTVDRVTGDVVERDYGKPCPHGNGLKLIFE